MKEAIEEYIKRCEKRSKTLDDMMEKATDLLSKERLVAKRTVYKDVARELKQLVEDEHQT